MDAGQSGDAPGTLAEARTLPAPGRYTGLLVTLDDAADVYKLDVARDTYLRVDVTAEGPVQVELLDPDGILVFTAAKTARVYTDKAGAWYFRVSTSLFAHYTLDVVRTAYPQNDGETHRDAGWRAGSALELSREGTIGNLTGAFADCADTWTLPVTAGEALIVRFEWLRAAPGVQLGWSTPGIVGHVSTTFGGAWRTVAATAAVNATWTFTTWYPVYTDNACASATAEYHASVGSLAPPPPPACANGLDDDNDTFIDWPLDVGCSSATDGDETNAPPPPPPPTPEIFGVLPNATRPGREIQVYGANISGATFTLGGVPVTKKRFDSLGLAYLTVPLLAPGEHTLVATLDGRSDVLLNATEVLAPADLAVVRVTTRAPPSGPLTLDMPDATRDVVVTVSNLAANDSEAYLLEVFILGRGQPSLGGLSKIGGLQEPALAGLAERTRTFTWDARLAAGSYDIVAVLRARTTGVPYSAVEADASNDRGTGSDWTYADPGVGARFKV